LEGGAGGHFIAFLVVTFLSSPTRRRQRREYFKNYRSSSSTICEVWLRERSECWQNAAHELFREGCERSKLVFWFVRACAPDNAGSPVRRLCADEGMKTAVIDGRTEQVEKALQEHAAAVNKQISGESQRVEVARDERSGRFVMTVVDSESGQLLRQFPPESVLKVNERLDELSGMLLAVEA
jgi:uncharacterized FlaG/YvyC family protein